MQTSAKSVEEQIFFNHFFLQLCVYHSPDPLPPCSLNEHLAPALKTLLETTSSDCTIDSLQAARFGRVAEDFFTGRSKVIHSSEIVVNDPFCFVEKEDFFLTHWPVVLLPLNRNFFFQTKVHVSCRGRVGRKMHSLAFVEWYRFANPKHTVDKLSGLNAMQSSHYKGDDIINVRCLIHPVVLAEVKKKTIFLRKTCLSRNKYQKH